jgi:hypothetical protein
MQNLLDESVAPSRLQVISIFFVKANVTVFLYLYHQFVSNKLGFNNSNGTLTYQHSTFFLTCQDNIKLLEWFVTLM